jgi:tetratricopeptide (TPR) repeat protein
VSSEHDSVFANLDEEFAKFSTSKARAISDATPIFDYIISRYEGKFLAENLNLVKILAFAYAIKALTQYEDGKLQAAIKTYERSKELYETYGLQNDGDQYARVVNRLAMMYEENKNVAEAKAAYETLATYWAKQTVWVENRPQNIYQARYYDTYATFLENSGDLRGAIVELDKAYEIRKKTEPNSIFTQKNKDRLAKMLETYAATQKAEQRPAATESVTAFPGSFHGSTQPPKPVSFPGTSVTLPLDSKPEAATEELAQAMKHTGL